MATRPCPGHRAAQLLKARDLDLLSPDDWQAYTAETIEIRKMTYSYRRTMLANDKKANKNKPNDKNAQQEPRTPSQGS